MEELRLKLHHIGVVTTDIVAESTLYLDMGYQPVTQIIHDPAQTALVQFFRLGTADHYVELVMPDGEQSKLTAATKRRQPLNHLCYVVDRIEDCSANLQSKGWLLISPPTPAVAFEMRRVAWLASRSSLVIELVEKGEGSGL